MARLADPSETNSKEIIQALQNALTSLQERGEDDLYTDVLLAKAGYQLALHRAAKRQREDIASGGGIPRLADALNGRR